MRANLGGNEAKASSSASPSTSTQPARAGPSHTRSRAPSTTRSFSSPSASCSAGGPTCEQRPSGTGSRRTPPTLLTTTGRSTR
eukprot:3666334-Lingulodinium_polyedra.AAC.1